jgi:hypothetical protein
MENSRTIVSASMRLAVVFVALFACKKVERYAPAENQPPPQVPSQQWQEVPGAGTGSAPVATGGCVADRVTRLVLEMEDRGDCTTGDDACKIDCAAGSATACFHRGAQLQRIPERIDEAIALFGRACELGSAIACTNHGASIWLRTEESACARRVFEKACSVKETFACGMIGRMMVGQAQDPAQVAEARAYLERTCQELGGAPCKMLANHLVANELGPFDAAQIRPLLQRACEGGDASACADLQSTGSR